MPPPFPTCGFELPAASPPTPGPRRCACRAVCVAASQCSRNALRRPGTRGNYDRAGCTTARRNRPPALAGSLPYGCARVRDPGTHDAIHLARSRNTPLVRASGCYQHRRGVLLDAPTAGALPGKPLSGGKEWSQGWVPLTEGRRWYALGSKALASTGLGQ